ncbi:MAG TPA: FAD-binding oxidoreductase, partial [Armatimonadota bacterium]|nr:FAD-binding oxidoreductase [Armatimonadota bacterium]
MESLSSLIGPENVFTGPETAAYAVAGMVPAGVAAPATPEEARQVILHAREQGWGLVPYGGGTQVAAGFPPSRLDLVLSTRRMARVVDYQPDDMTVTVEPGLTLDALERLLAGRNQFLPLDPPLPATATVGGTVAAAVAGPWSAGFGTPRDWVIGCRVLGADGQEVRAGGQVVKNVAGYDLPKLYTGSSGTLGLITEVTFKVMPRPPARGHCAVRLRAAGEAENLVARTLASDLQPAALELVYAPLTGPDNPHPWALYYEFLHVEEAIEWQVTHVQQLSGEVGGEFERPTLAAGDAVFRQLRDRPALSLFVARLGGASSQVTELALAAASACDQAGIQAEMQAHAAAGQLYLLAGAA